VSTFQRALDRCAAFAARWRLAFSAAPGKSALVRFHSLGRQRWPGYQFTLTGQTLVWETQYKFLGVVLHETLSWKPHFEYLMKRAQFAAFQVQRLIPKLVQGTGRSVRVGGPLRSVGGPHFPAIRALVLGAVYARATYGIQFMSGPGVAAMLDKLESICVRPLRAILALPGSTHIRSILAEADIPSIQLFRQQLLLSFAQRTMTLDAAHPSRLLFERSLRTLSQVNKPLGRYNNVTNLPCRVRSGVRDYCRPMLYDVLEAEHRWGVQVLPRALPAPDAPQPHPGASLTCARLEEMHGYPVGTGGDAAAVPHCPSTASLSVPVAPLSDCMSQAESGGAGKRSSSLSLLARKRAVAEWQHEASGGELLRSLKSRSGRSWYLYVEKRPTAILRARLRFNRAFLAESLFQRGLADSPLCKLHPRCRTRGEHQTVDHALLHCPAISEAREVCRRELRAIGVRSLDLSILLNGMPPVKAPKRTQSAVVCGSVASVAQPMPAPVAVYFPGQAACRPSAAPPKPSERRRAELEPMRQSLTITAGLLQALLKANHDEL
jgi:hypothetical protein